MSRLLPVLLALCASASVFGSCAATASNGPQQVHVSLTHNVDEMHVMFATMGSNSLDTSAQVAYGTSPGTFTQKVRGCACVCVCVCVNACKGVCVWRGGGCGKDCQAVAVPHNRFAPGYCRPQNVLDGRHTVAWSALHGAVDWLEALNQGVLRCECQWPNKPAILFHHRPR